MHLPQAAVLCAALLVGALASPAADEPSAYRDPAQPVETRVADLLRRLTLEEKLSLLSGDRGFYIHPIPRLGLPEIKMADGPLGVRNYGESTAYPATVALGASWDRELAEVFGAALARDCRARGVHILLAPGVNIQRVPHNGRNFEYLSEDPLLAARIGVGIIRGLQSHGVVATVKHYAANNQETERMTIDPKIGERALREIYLPAFKAAVQDGQVWAVMNAYNRLNGHYATAQDWLNNRTLKAEWGFRGVLMSDWGATHDTLTAANGGLDLEMPGGDFLTPKQLEPLLKSGAVTLTNVDDKVRRILRLEIANGFLDRPQLDSSIPLDDPQSAAVSLRIAREGTTLLKNDGALLPLDRTRAHRIVVLGPTADILPAGDGSSRVQPFHSTSLLAGLRALAGKDVTVDFIPDAGAAAIDRLFADTSYASPIQRELFDGVELAGKPVDTRTVAQIAEDWSGHAPVAGLTDLHYSARWTTTIAAPTDDNYLFVVRSDDGARVVLDDEMILDCWGIHAVFARAATLPLKAGVTHRLRVEYFQNDSDAVVRFGWGKNRLDDTLDADMRERVRAADAVIVSVGYTLGEECEGVDRTYELPVGQPELIRAVTALNPRTVVVLNSGGAVATADWIDGVPAFVQSWFPGQDGGRVVAEILFGELNPSGKLPFTYPRRWEETAAYGNYPGANGKVDYAEGVFVGYRWSDHKRLTPLFPFGHGLSYTSFRYDEARARRDVDGRTTVTFTLTNTGPRAGAEIAQVYVEPPPAAVPRPPRELKGFARVELQPGETKSVSVTLDADAFAYFDEPTSAWKTEPGTYTLAIGASSRDLRLRAPLEVR